MPLKTLPEKFWNQYLHEMIVYGPVTSRRLGLSLGINNISPSKLCSYNCVYCQEGKTIRQSATLRQFYDPETIYRETLAHLEKLDKNHWPDYLTIVSNGEPTLDIQLKETAAMLRKLGFPLALITNASLFSEERVREAIQEFDWLSVKMDAPDDVTWRKINHPVRNLSFENHMAHIHEVVREFHGILCTETMLVSGLNDQAETVAILAGMIAGLSPSKAYVSVPIRPPAYKGVAIPDEASLTQAWQIYTDHGLNTEVLAGFEGIDTGYTGNAFEDLLNITSVHPLREDSVENLLAQNNSDFSVIDDLISQHLLSKVNYNGHTYYLRHYHV